MRAFRVVLLTAGLSVSLAASDLVTYESLTVAATSIGITSTVLSPGTGGQIRFCSIRLETAQIRFRFDGTAPTAAEGTLLEVGDVLEISNHADARRMRFIRTGAVSGVAKIHCWQ